jgi:hypothetical protein
VFLFRRNGPATRPLTVFYDIDATGATNGVDYETIASSATFSAGEATLTVIILPFDDPDIEGREDVVLSLVQDAGYVVGAPNTGLVRIADNDFPVGRLGVRLRRVPGGLPLEHAKRAARAPG